MINITVWSDFACPYCYIGETRLNNAIKELGMQDKVEINYRAFELDPTASKEVTSTTPVRFAMKYRLSVPDAEKQIEQISQLGREVGLDFRYATTLYSNTRDAHRLMKLAEAKYDHKTVEQLNEALFADYFTKNLVLADQKVLLDTAVAVGMDADEVKRVLDSNEYDDEVRFDEREAAMRGVHGVPYMLFNGSFAVPGALSTDALKSVLKRELAKEVSSVTDDTSDKPTERPHICDKDGCRL